MKYFFEDPVRIPCLSKRATRWSFGRDKSAQTISRSHDMQTWHDKDPFLFKCPWCQVKA